MRLKVIAQVDAIPLIQREKRNDIREIRLHLRVNYADKFLVPISHLRIRGGVDMLLQ